MLITDKGKKILNKHYFDETTTTNVGNAVGVTEGRDRQITFLFYDDDIQISYISVDDPTIEDPRTLKIPKGLEEIKKEITVEEEDL